jgi:biotin carboxyl carrier protein
LTFEIEINGRSRAVSVERIGASGLFRVTIDGDPIVVDAQRTGDYGLSLLFPESAHEATTVQIAPGPAPGTLLAYLSGRTAAASVNGRRTGRGGAEAGGSTHGEQQIVAPMPGRVVRVLVAPGDTVEARQPIIVVEAMKMENELRSPKAGRVKDVGVAAGASVEAGRVLVVVE